MFDLRRYLGVSVTYFSYYWILRRSSFDGIDDAIHVFFALRETEAGWRKVVELITSRVKQ